MSKHAGAYIMPLDYRSEARCDPVRDLSDTCPRHSPRGYASIAARHAAVAGQPLVSVAPDDSPRPHHRTDVRSDQKED